MRLPVVVAVVYCLYAGLFGLWFERRAYVINTSRDAMDRIPQ